MVRTVDPTGVFFKHFAQLAVAKLRVELHPRLSGAARRS
jgi:hypothetical protein